MLCVAVTVVCCGSGTDLWVRGPPCWLICQVKWTETFSFLGLPWEQLRSVSLAPQGQQPLTSGNPPTQPKKINQQQFTAKRAGLQTPINEAHPPPFHHHLHLLLPRYHWRWVCRRPWEQRRSLARRPPPSGQGLGENLQDVKRVSGEEHTESDRNQKTLRRISIVNDMSRWPLCLQKALYLKVAPSGLEMLVHYKWKRWCFKLLNVLVSLSICLVLPRFYW